MKSNISKVLSGYKTALEHAKKTYEEEYNLRIDNALDFYDIFLKDLIIDFSEFKNLNSPKLKRVIDFTRTQFKDVKFIAIDGTCFKENMDPYMVFFSCAYAVRGEIKLNTADKKVIYEKWSAEQDKSVVSFLPIPYANLSQFIETDNNGEIKVFEDEQKIDFITIHLDLMKLAEIYLAYSMTQTDMRPNLILLDQSISSSFNAQGIGRSSGENKIKILNKQIFGITIDENDVKIAYTHPYNDKLDVPSPKEFKINDFIVRKLTEAQDHKISYNDLLKYFPHISSQGANDFIKRIKQRIDQYLNNDKSNNVIYYDDMQKELKLNPKYYNSWDRLSQLFGLICKSLFEEKTSDQNSGMVYTAVKNGIEEKQWFVPEDIKFLIAIGYRLLIEACWKYNIYLVGIAKDSSTAYFSKNYLNVFKNHNQGRAFEKYSYDNMLGELPWTDRLLLEAISYCKPNILSPWSTIEIDSSIITLRKFLEKDTKNNLIPIIKGSGQNNNIYYPERIFLRSLAQFYINRSKPIPSAGHVIFIDRLILPNIDKKITLIDLSEPSYMDLIFFENNKSTNLGQEVCIFVLDILTKNLFPEVVGYPDPLHKADWGAKSLGDKIRPMISSSQIILKGNPLIKKLRTLRAEGGGR